MHHPEWHSPLRWPPATAENTNHCTLFHVKFSCSQCCVLLVCSTYGFSCFYVPVVLVESSCVVLSIFPSVCLSLNLWVVFLTVFGLCQVFGLWISCSHLFSCYWARGEIIAAALEHKVSFLKESISIILHRSSSDWLFVYLVEFALCPLETGAQQKGSRQIHICTLVRRCRGRYITEGAGGLWL